MIDEQQLGMCVTIGYTLAECTVADIMLLEILLHAVLGTNTHIVQRWLPKLRCADTDAQHQQ